MIAAIYARRSNEQHVSDDAKSITRQVTRAREMAAKEGWECPDRYVFVDDGITGFESVLRPGLQRLLAACAPQEGERSFNLVIVSEQ
jgi:DNA invertase Pin-like site-specific DNA recombinase